MLIIEQQFSDASTCAIPPYNWIPPEWLSGPPPALGSTVDLVPDYAPITLNCNRQIEGNPGADPNLQNNPPVLGKLPHPCSDFSHIDPDDFNAQDLTNAACLPAATLERLRRLVGPDSIGMQRLKLVFEWTLCHVQSLLAEVNEGLGVGASGASADPVRYANAREAYIKFLKDLDDHEPEVTPDGVVPGTRGYGRAIKWVFIFPAIFQNKIQGARVILKWNPHSSSSGLPIQHK